MKIWRRIVLRERQKGKKQGSKGLLPCFLLFMFLTLVLVTCGNGASTSAPASTPITQATTPATQTGSASTPASTPGTGQNTPGTGATNPGMPLRSIRMLDTKNGWALTANTILKTGDGGVHWQDITPANAELNQFARGDFLNGQYAWIAIPPPQQVEGPSIAILRTVDGGKSWQRASIADPMIASIDVPHFLNAQQGWLEASASPGAGHAGSDIWHSIDGGQTWTKIATNGSANSLTLGYVSGISFKDAQTGLATGNLGAGADNSVPSVSITHDGGQSWQTQSLPHLLGGYTVTTNNSEPPVFFGNTVVMPVNVTTDNGENLLVLYRSNTSGQTWFQTSVVHIRSDNTYVLDSTHAWATDSQSGRFYRTTDGGTNWSSTSTTAFGLKALSFTDASNGWGVTSQALLHTTDGGTTWQQIFS